MKMSWRSSSRFSTHLRIQRTDLAFPTGILRATNVLMHYRGFVWPENEALQAYVQRLLTNPAVKRTCSAEELYLDSYERSVYAFRPSPLL